MSRRAPDPEESRPRLSENDPWLLQRIRESINSGLVVVDGDGRVVSFNKAAEEITGYRRDDVLGGHFTHVFGEANRETLEAEFSRPTPRLENREVSIKSRAGEELPIGFTVSPLMDEHDRRLGTIFIFKDLTEIVSLREEMRRREHLATVGEMTASIAHEIRNPLAAIHTAAETLREELGYDEEKEESIAIILNEAKRVNALVSNFFTYVRPMSLKIERCDVHELLDVLIFIEGAKMQKAGITLRSRYCAGAPRVLADRNLLQQALLNIILNAYQASTASGQVTISTEVRDDPPGPSQVRMSISDQGAGIAPEEMSRIFQPFFSTKSKGVGLGLPITERIIKALGGRIEIESEPGRGATFTIVLAAAI